MDVSWNMLKKLLNCLINIWNRMYEVIPVLVRPRTFHHQFIQTRRTYKSSLRYFQLFNLSNYSSESKVLQYFCIMRSNSVTPNAFASEAVKVTNHIELCEAELAWYSPSPTQWICLNGLEHGLRIHCFKLIWPCLIDLVLAARSKFLYPHLLVVVQWSTSSWSFMAPQVFLVASIALWSYSKSLCNA